MSDGFTDSKRTGDIADASNLLLRAEELFLLRPTKGRLNRVYDLGKKLDDLPRGVLIYDSRGMGGLIVRHYEKKGRNKYSIKADDLAFLLERVWGGKDRVNLLADMMTLGSRVKDQFLHKFYFPLMRATNWFDVEEDEGFPKNSLWNWIINYDKDFDKNVRFLEDSFSMTHAKILDQNKISAEEFDRMMIGSGVKERFPVRYRV